MLRIGLGRTPMQAIMILAVLQSTKTSEPFSVPIDKTASSKEDSPTLIKQPQLILLILSLQSATSSSNCMV